MTYVFVSYVFDLANAKSAILGGESFGETSTDVSSFREFKDKNKISEQICKKNSYNRHYLVTDCLAHCYESTIKDRPERNYNLPNGNPCGGGKTCKYGSCGGPDDENDRNLKAIYDYIDNSETLKAFSPESIAAIKARLRKLQPMKPEEAIFYIEKLAKFPTGADRIAEKYRKFKPAHS